MFVLGLKKKPPPKKRKRELERRAKFFFKKSVRSFDLMKAMISFAFSASTYGRGISAWRKARWVSL